jgi:hypothetical protein
MSELRAKVVDVQDFRIELAHLSSLTGNEKEVQLKELSDQARALKKTMRLYSV